MAAPYYVEWHIQGAWKELLFADEELRDTRDPVLPPEPSESVIEKKQTLTTVDGLPVQSFLSLLETLGTLTRNRCVMRLKENSASANDRYVKRYCLLVGIERTSRRRESNSQPTVYKTVALPLSYVGGKCCFSRKIPRFLRHLHGFVHYHTIALASVQVRQSTRKFGIRDSHPFLDSWSRLRTTFFMIRTARVVIPDVPHHVTQRGNNQQDVFFVDNESFQPAPKTWQNFLRQVCPFFIGIGKLLAEQGFMFLCR